MSLLLLLLRLPSSPGEAAHVNVADVAAAGPVQPHAVDVVAHAGLLPAGGRLLNRVIQQHLNNSARKVELNE